MSKTCVSAKQGAAEGPTAARLTVGFNMARMLEAAGDVRAAAREYKVCSAQFCHDSPDNSVLSP